MRASLSCWLMAAAALWAGAAVAQPAAPPPPPPPPPPVEPAQPSQPPPPPTEPSPPTDTPPPVEPPPPPAPPPQAPPPLPPPPPILFVPPRMVAVDEPRPDTDLLPVMAGTSVSVGAIFIISGAVVLGTSDPGQYCGIGGCIDRPDRESTNLGATLIGAGAGFAATGGLAMFGLADMPRGFERRRSQALMVTGFSFTCLAAAGLGAGIAQGATYSPDGDLDTTWPWIMASTLSAGVGIPMLVIGSKVRTQEQRDADRARRTALRDPRTQTELYSRGLVGIGSAATGVGGTAIIAGTGIFLADVAAGGPAEVSSNLALPVVGAGTILTAIGIPLIVVGARREIVDAAPEQPPPFPEIRATGAGLSATWSLR